MKIVLAPVLGLAAIYLAIAATAFFKQRSMIYYPIGDERPTVAGFRLVEVETADGVELTAGFRAAVPGKPTFIAFHGNAADWQSMAEGLQPLAEKGFGILSMAYRGYRGRPGEPTERGLYDDGRAGLRWLNAEGVPDNQIVAIGNSLGSGVAVQLASERKLRALILVSPISSISRLASAKVGWLPVDLLLTDRFDNLAKIGSISSPILILHGDADRVIPLAEGRLLTSANPSARLVTFVGAGHDLMYQPQIAPFIEDFLSGS